MASFDEVERSGIGKEPLEDLATLLDSPRVAFTDLLRLLRALHAGTVITGVYRDHQGRGCLLHILIGVCSKAELLATDFGCEEVWWAARRVVRHWDAHRLQAHAVALAVKAAIARRLRRSRLARLRECAMAGAAS
jgi:hypothetical protein